MRHMGREYGVVLAGRLRVTIGFDEEEYELGPGDSIAFESSRPHRLENAGDEPVEAIWFVVGRSQSDARKLASGRRAHGRARLSGAHRARRVDSATGGGVRWRCECPVATYTGRS